MIACFAKDEGELFFLVNSTGQFQLTNGKSIWFKTEQMAFPNYYYSDKHLTN